MKGLPQGRRGAETQGKILCCFVTLLLCVGLFANVSAQDEVPTFEDLFYPDSVTLLEELPLEISERPSPTAMPLPNAILSHEQSCGDFDVVNASPKTSPDGRFIVFFDCYVPGAEAYNVYVYEVATGDIYTLGASVPPTFYLRMDRWLNDTQIALVSVNESSIDAYRSLYVGDVTQAGSLREIARQYVEAPVYEEVAALYFWVSDNGESYSVYSYDPTEGMNGNVRLLLERPCMPLDDIPCAFVRVYTNAGYNNGEPTRLALLFSSTDIQPTVAQIEVYNLPEGELIYTHDIHRSGYAGWLDADRLMLFGVDYDVDVRMMLARLVQFDGIQTVDREINHVYWQNIQSPDRSHLLVYDKDPDDGAINNLDLDTFIEKPLMRSVPAPYHVEFTQTEEPNVFIVYLLDRSQQNLTLARWLIQVNE